MQATDITNLYSPAIHDGREPGPDGLPWHWGARAERPTPRTPLVAPDIRGELALEHRGLFRSDRLWVNGKPAPRVDRSHAYALRTPDGRLVQARLRPALGRTLPDLVVEGRVVPQGERLPTALVVLVFLPFLLGALFGWVGAVTGAIAVLFNRSLARQAWGHGLKAAAMLSSLGGAAAVSLVAFLVLRVLGLG